DTVDDNPAGDTYTVGLTGLRCGTTYTFRIRARGDGTKTLDQFTGDEEAPQISPTTARCPMVSISYTPPPGGDSASVEEGASLTFTIEADVAPRAILPVVVLATEEGMFLADDPPRRQTVNIEARQRTATVEFATLDDEVREGTGIIRATVVDGDGYDLGTPATAGVTIEDNEPALATPQNLDIEPLPERRARLTWDEVPLAPGGQGAVSYRVQVRVAPSGSWHVAPGSPTTSAALEIDLDRILVDQSSSVSREAGLAHHLQYQFRVMAFAEGPISPGSTEPPELSSHQSTSVTLADNPLLLRDGLAYGAVRRTPPDDDGPRMAVLQWASLDGASSYSLRYRRLGAHGAYQHFDEQWRLTEVVQGPWQASNANVAILPPDPQSPDLRRGRIYHLSDRTIYAVQLNYVHSDLGTVFAARDAYVWAAGYRPDSGGGTPERVATFPYYGYFPGATYAYHICVDTFPSELTTPVPGGTTTYEGNWVSLIDAAIGTWQQATAGRITTSRVSLSCPTPTWSHDYDITRVTCERTTDGVLASIFGPTALLIPDVVSDFFAGICQDVADAILDLEGATLDVVSDTVRLAEAFWRSLEGVDDNGVSEVRFIDQKSDRDVEFITSIYKLCIFAPGGGCSTSPAYAEGNRGGNQIGSADIFLNWRRLRDRTDDHLQVASPAVIQFNTCIWPRDSRADQRAVYAFETVVHEAGHALGLSGASIQKTAVELALQGLRLEIELDYPVSHPTIPSSVVNYNSEVGATKEPDCYPHPLDVMAIHALYQTGYPEVE
ncbi:MAG: fibronectin type III domain-containing protein, partial [Chloroflexi bacterium]|nr:fibronectin type III domain-containing protein [Chloroflexota bacterium]